MYGVLPYIACMSNAQRNEIIANAAAHGRELRRLSRIEGTPEHAQRLAIEARRAETQRMLRQARGEFGWQV